MKEHETTIEQLRRQLAEANCRVEELTTELARLRRELAESQEKLSMATELAGLAHWEYDFTKDEYTFDESFFALYATTAEAEGGCRMSSADYVARFLPPEERTVVADSVARQLASRKHDRGQLEHRIVRRDGEIRHIVVRFQVIRDEAGNPARCIGVNQYITEGKRMEEALRQQIVALTRPLDETADIRISDLFSIEALQRIQDSFAEATGVASVITLPDGTPITRPSRTCRLCVEIIKKTDKGLQNCLKSYMTFCRHNPAGPTIQTCLSGGLLEADASICVGGRHIANWLIGQARDTEQDVDTMLAYAAEIGADPDEYRRALAEVPSMSRNRFEKIAQTLYILANELSLRAYQNVQQARFIAERQRAGEALVRAKEAAEAGLREKVVLIREIHHRVKNNLQVISSLLSLQASQIRGDCAAPLLESLGRVRSMALVHEKLYASDNVTRIDMVDYVRNLSRSLLKLFSGPSQRIDIAVAGRGSMLDVNTAIPCGIIINELISNAIKHGFAGRESGCVRVAFETREGRMAITVSDDGIGLPGDFNLQGGATLGMLIIRELTEQVRGTLTYQNGQGAAFTIGLCME